MTKLFSSQTNRSSQSKFDCREPFCTGFCSNCGSPLESDDVFCSECGAPIDYEEKEEANNNSEAIEISSDRMASITETSKIKSGEISNNFKNLRLFDKNRETAERAITLTETQNKTLKTGFYVYRGNNMTQYLSIDNIQGNFVKASVRTNFSNLSYSTEFYEGTIIEDKIRLHIVNSDLHPAAGFSIRLSEHFDGTVKEKSISGNFTGEFSSSAIFIKC